MNIRETMRSAIAARSPSFVKGMYDALLVEPDHVSAFVDGNGSLTIRQIELLLTYLDFRLESRV